MTEVKLPSGAVLKITIGSFAEGRDLYQAVMSEVKDLTVDPEAEVDANFLKNIFCSMAVSKKVEAAVWACMKRCTYDGERITGEDTFEKVERRDDYLRVCFEVAKANIQPFTKSLYAEYSHILGELQGILA